MSKCAQHDVKEEDGALEEIKNLELLFNQGTEERAQAKTRLVSDSCDILPFVRNPKLVPSL